MNVLFIQIGILAATVILVLAIIFCARFYQNQNPEKRRFSTRVKVHNHRHRIVQLVAGNFIIEHQLEVGDSGQVMFPALFGGDKDDIYEPMSIDMVEQAIIYLIVANKIEIIRRELSKGKLKFKFKRKGNFFGGAIIFDNEQDQLMLVEFGKKRPFYLGLLRKNVFSRVLIKALKTAGHSEREAMQLLDGLQEEAEFRIKKTE